MYGDARKKIKGHSESAKGSIITILWWVCVCVCVSMWIKRCSENSFSRRVHIVLALYGRKLASVLQQHGAYATKHAGCKIYMTRKRETDSVSCIANIYTCLWRLNKFTLNKRHKFLKRDVRCFIIMCFDIFMRACLAIFYDLVKSAARSHTSVDHWSFRPSAPRSGLFM
jgi:hypothetical protein